MNKFGAGDKVEYIDLNDKKICATIVKYKRVKTIVFGQEVINVVAELSNGELINSRHLKAYNVECMVL